MKQPITASIEIKDSDIATIEALHDILLDSGTLPLNSKTLTNSRALTRRMYKAIMYARGEIENMNIF